MGPSADILASPLTKQQLAEEAPYTGIWASDRRRSSGWASSRLFGSVWDHPARERCADGRYPLSMSARVPHRVPP